MSMKTGRMILGAMLIFAVIALLGAVYVGGYWWLGEEQRWSSAHDAYIHGERVWIDDGLTIERSYSQPWQAQIFKLAGWVESRLRKIDVEVIYRDPSLQQYEGLSLEIIDEISVEVD